MMTYSGEEILAWVAAPEIKEAVKNFDEADLLHEAAVKKRVEEASFYAGYVLLERLEQIDAEHKAATEALAKLGIDASRSPVNAEDEPEDVLFTLDDFMAADDERGERRVSPVWGKLRN